jgi:hypothetical protein
MAITKRSDCIGHVSGNWSPGFNEQIIGANEQVFGQAAYGSNENIRQWRSEEVDLREVYRHIWPDGTPAHLIDIAIFCDSDETHGHTVSYFADVKLRR